MPCPRSYVALNKPAIFRGAASHWPAIDKWTDEYLRYICASPGFPCPKLYIFPSTVGVPYPEQRWRWQWLRTGTRTRCRKTRGCSSCRTRKPWPWVTFWVRKLYSMMSRTNDLMIFVIDSVDAVVNQNRSFEFWPCSSLTIINQLLNIIQYRNPHSTVT